MKKVSKFNTNLSIEGVNLFGYVTGTFGVAQGARLAGLAMKATNISVGVHPLQSAVHTMDEELPPELIISSDVPYFFNYLHFNADEACRAHEKVDKQYLEGRYNIGFWAWELSRFPDEWQPAIDFIDEIWVPSVFISDALKKKTDKPVHVVPHPVVGLAQPKVSREYFNIPKDTTVFLMTFDLLSFVERKNPFAVIRAFKGAFSKKDKVSLVIKIQSGLVNKDVERQKIYAAIGGDERIILIDKVLHRSEVEALHSCSDVFVSLHRSEGFGFGLAESMKAGKPVIATNYSGNVDYMSPDDSCLVPYKLISVKEGEYPCWQDQVWADPDIDVAIDWMRRLHSSPDLRSSIGAKANARITKQLSLNAVGFLMSSRLDHLKTDLFEK